jgi:hypothetical protein
MDRNEWRQLKHGCVWVAAVCHATPRSAQFSCGIAQSFEDFRDRPATLNLRVVGSIPTRLTSFNLLNPHDPNSDPQ